MKTLPPLLSNWPPEARHEMVYRAGMAFEAAKLTPEQRRWVIAEVRRTWKPEWER